MKSELGLSLTKNDIDVILESLKHAKASCEAKNYYPSQDFKNEKLREIDELQTKLRLMKK
ncbi:hypothetical protein [Vibrio coralliilyticus]|uniref:hypothetical protein n=1 Tax=Vibrio coralliilyticus TaxID=190893 RepID=UPI00148B8FAD|nr:hypothetical protein [Vibrio coralliilyticus]NOI29563.1 hypothetical protein [Vibrio coralliilyticus]NOI48778.1 hypothetical protein [Vibrio coralliilyticus]WFB49923.1 hypothetical protein P6988_24085 [Vibrio coralliilyticus]